jgi:hypothetical protein
MNLAEVFDRLHEFDHEGTIYAREPWCPTSEAIVATEPASGGLPESARRRALAYFLEVFVAREFLDDWVSSSSTPPTPEEQVQRLIHYAVYDA